MFQAYYGGEARCDVEHGENFNPEELVCGGCSDIAKAQVKLKPPIKIPNNLTSIFFPTRCAQNTEWTSWNTSVATVVRWLFSSASEQHISVTLATMTFND